MMGPARPVAENRLNLSGRCGRGAVGQSGLSVGNGEALTAAVRPIS